MLGLVKYNADTDSFDMTQLSNVLAGGCSEAKRCLTQHLSALKEIRLACTMIGAGLCSIGFFFTWLRIAERRNQQLRLKAQVNASKPLPKQENEAGRTECICCMDKPAVVVFTPCSHMITCEICADELRSKD